MIGILSFVFSLLLAFSASANPYLAKPNERPISMRVSTCAVTGGSARMLTAISCGVTAPRIDPMPPIAPAPTTVPVLSIVPKTGGNALKGSIYLAGVTEGICAPMNEVDSYNTLFRDPAGKGTPK